MYSENFAQQNLEDFILFRGISSKVPVIVSGIGSERVLVLEASRDGVVIPTVEEVNDVDVHISQYLEM
jgi:hypothetical protein